MLIFFNAIFHFYTYNGCMADKSKKKFYQNEKFQKVFYPVAYFILIVAFVACGCIAFDKLYYDEIYVSGNSMNPTLIGYQGGRHHYGKADKSRRAVDHLNRFDVVITYYPESWGTEPEIYKIKRVWAFPGETIKMTKDDSNLIYTVSKGETTVAQYTATIDGDYATFKVENKNFRVAVAAGSYRTSIDYSMRSGEYFLMGDNWFDSGDSYYYHSKGEYVTNSLIQGKVVRIDGTARVSDKGELYDKQPVKGMYDF